MTVHYKANEESELAGLMHKALASDSVEKATNADKITKGLKCLNKAASIFESLHESKVAETATVILEKLSGER